MVDYGFTIAFIGLSLNVLIILSYGIFLDHSPPNWLAYPIPPLMALFLFSYAVTFLKKIGKD